MRHVQLDAEEGGSTIDILVHGQQHFDTDEDEDREGVVAIVAEIIGDGVRLPDISRPFFVIIAVGTALSAFIASFIICRLVFARKNFRVNKL
jgi:hypothetical protein